PGGARRSLEMPRDGQADLFARERVDRRAPALERRSRAAVDVVLLDLGLPDSKGIETFHRAHDGAAGQPIIVISGLDDETLALEAVRSGAQDYLVKGRIEGHLLARVIRYAIERQRTEVQLRWLTLAVDQSPASVFITDPRGTWRDRAVPRRAGGHHRPKAHRAGPPGARRALPAARGQHQRGFLRPGHPVSRDAVHQSRLREGLGPHVPEPLR